MGRTSEDIGPPIVVTPHKPAQSNSHCPIVFPQWTNSSLARPTVASAQQICHLEIRSGSPSPYTESPLVFSVIYFH